MHYALRQSGLARLTEYMSAWAHAHECDAVLRIFLSQAKISLPICTNLFTTVRPKDSAEVLGGHRGYDNEGMLTKLVS